MASITIRGLDEALKRELRLRAARNGRSMEDEVRTILGAAAAPEAGATSPPEPQLRDAPADPDPARPRILLIIGGGIAAYKSLDLIRRLRERGAAVRCILTAAAQEFITPLSAGALSGERVLTDLFDRDSEFDVGHIRLARTADLVIVAPATADLMAKMAGGHADDLGSAVLLATGAPVLIAPAMNPHMWATRRPPATWRSSKLTASRSWVPGLARWRSVAKPGSGAWPSRWRLSRRRNPCSPIAAGHRPSRRFAASRCW